MTHRSVSTTVHRLPVGQVGLFVGYLRVRQVCLLIVFGQVGLFAGYLRARQVCLLIVFGQVGLFADYLCARQVCSPVTYGPGRSVRRLITDGQGRSTHAKHIYLAAK